MPEFSETQLRIVYSLLKPALRMAARFHLPMRTLSEMVRLAYFEALQRQGLSQTEVAARLGQTDRHIRSLARRFREDFFVAETQIGLVREIENHIARHNPTRRQLLAKLSQWTTADIEHALATLGDEGRITSKDGRYAIAAKYVVMSSEKFHHRIDALNHFLGAAYQSIVQRLIHDEREQAIIKTISFTALPAQLKAFASQLEGNLRRDIATLEENAQFEGGGEERYSLGLCMAVDPEDTPS